MSSVKLISKMILLSTLICAISSDEQNINKFLNNQVIVSRQIMCVLEKSPCDNLGRQLKGNVNVVLFFASVFLSYQCYLLFLLLREKKNTIEEEK